MIYGLQSYGRERRRTIGGRGHRLIVIGMPIMILSGFLAPAQQLVAGGNSSLSESKIENADMKVAAEADVSTETELRGQLALARNSIKTLTESLAAANMEAESFRLQYSDLHLRMEALGLESADKNRAGLEQRLLNAVSDLRLVREERDKYRNQVLSLSEAVIRFVKTSPDVDALARMELEAQLRESSEVASQTGCYPEEAGTLMDGRVVGVKEEWSLVVGNIGEKHGVKLGMPMRVMRGDKQVATVRVVDVRHRICGAVIQGMDFGKIGVGDRLQVDAHQNVSLK
jgi:hypothetical protein